MEAKAADSRSRALLAKMAFFDEVALQEAVWKEEQIDMRRLGLPREVFATAERGLNVSENLRCLTGADA
jgi:hypothetical protein